MTPQEIARKTVTITDGKKQIYALWYRPLCGDAWGTVLLSHGFNGTADDFEKECICLAQHGLNALAYDFCGGSMRSRSSGDTRQMSVLTEAEDLELVMTYVQETEAAGQRPLLLFGGSQGGLVSALVAARRPEQVAAMALYYPALCIPRDWQAKYPAGKEIPVEIPFWEMELGRRYAEDAIGLDVFREVYGYHGKVLLVHGDRDEIVDLAFSKQAAAAWRDARLVVLPGEGHGFSDAGRETALRHVVEFFKENVQ